MPKLSRDLHNVLGQKVNLEKMQKSILYVTDYSYSNLPVSLENCVTRWTIMQHDAFSTNEKFDIILVYNGSDTLNNALVDYLILQHQIGVPIILFPYMLLHQTNLSTPKLWPMHPMVPGNQLECDKNKYKDATWCAILPHHCILQRVTTVTCRSLYRQSSKAKDDAVVIATWPDDIPLVVEYNNVVALNFCLTHYDHNSNASILIMNTIDYLLNKKRSIFKSVAKHYCDMQVLL